MKNRLLVLFVLAALCGLTFGQGSSGMKAVPNASKAVEPTTNSVPGSFAHSWLGISVSLPDGRLMLVPVQLEKSANTDMVTQPIAGIKNVSAIKVYPYLAGDKVAVRVAALVSEPTGTASSSSSAISKTIGTYVLGHVGDTINLNDLQKIGLPSLAVEVVDSSFKELQVGPVCCVVGGGSPDCCGKNLDDMCTNCKDKSQCSAFCDEIIDAGIAKPKPTKSCRHLIITPANTALQAKRIEAPATAPQ